MLSVLLSDVLKVKKKLVWFLAVAGPAGVILLEALNFGLRYDWLTKIYKEDLWGGLIDECRWLGVPALMLGLTIVASIMAGIEHQTNAWKQLLALPVSKAKVFTGKFLMLAGVLFLSSTLLGLGIMALGLGLGFGTDIPYRQMFEITYYPFLAVLPFIALQIWLSIMIKNQAIALMAGIIGTILTLYGPAFPDWMPYKWAFLENEWNRPVYSAAAGVLTGAAVFLAGLRDFVKRDVK